MANTTVIVQAPFHFLGRSADGIGMGPHGVVDMVFNSLEPYEFHFMFYVDIDNREPETQTWAVSRDVVTAAALERKVHTIGDFQVWTVSVPSGLVCVLSTPRERA